MYRPEQKVNRKILMFDHLTAEREVTLLQFLGIEDSRFLFYYILDADLEGPFDNADESSLNTPSSTLL